MNMLLIVGILIIIGIIGARLVQKIKLPSVVGWLVTGAIMGPSVFKLLTPTALDALGFLSDITLGLIGVIIGLEITMGTLQRLGKGIIPIILFESFGAFLLVFFGVYTLTRNLPLSLVFGSMAPASAPAGTVAVLKEYKARGPLTKALLVTVGADDALAIIIFVFAASFSKVLVSGKGFSLLTLLGKPFFEIALAIGIGGAIGWLLGFSLQKLRLDGVLLPISLAAILVCVGLSKNLHFSLILATVVAGAVLVNFFPRVSRRVSGNLESFVQPFYVCFFVLAGAHLDLKLLLGLGTLGAIYVLCRTAGLMGGARLGASLGKQPTVIKRYLGLGILSQAGVAVGLAYLIVKEFAALGPQGGEIATLIITTIAATTIVFEIVGPICTKIAIKKAGEMRVSE
jgi:Kef-type K+ transport system membrane component KefB